MQAPNFWWRQKPNFAARLLTPLASIYGAIAARRLSRRGVHAAVPVICVGNFTIGGAGKTPTAIAIARQLEAQGERPVFLIRGYGGAAGRGPQLVDTGHHNPKDVGDEALLLARVAPTIVGTDRVASAGLAEQIGASLLILDDGMQNPALIHDFRLAVIDEGTGLGNGLCIPAGPLRAPFYRQLMSVSAVLIIGTGDSAAMLTEEAYSSGKFILHGKLIATRESMGFAGRRVFAFAGIGLPEKFKATLQDLGAIVVGWQSFPDHHLYSLKELRRLQTSAQRNGALLLTTEKDFVRIVPLIDRLNKDQPLPMALPIDLVFNDSTALEKLLRAALTGRRG
jgi:tetraacyldisaccharide 4'-kinase